MYLAAAGVGQIDLWDADIVDRSNLQRQVQFTEADVGQSKVSVLKDRLMAINRDCSVTVQPRRWSAAHKLPGDLVIDATDNFATRFELNRAAHDSARMLVSGAATRWAGQVAVFASGVVSGSPCYQCFVPEIPPDAEACEDAGVVGPVTGIVASHMALETLKLITGAGRTLAGRIKLVDGLAGEGRSVKLPRDPACPVCGEAV
jgi:molybdopterin/thiamine biosynthesis adenylyltransferase